MEKRALGKTGIELSLLGFGGFHLVEVDTPRASHLLNTYLDNGGNYIETAASYGDGISETRIGRSVARRRSEYVLATKSMERTQEGCTCEIERSLKNLGTDHVDIFFLHCVQTAAEVDRILGPGGAMDAAVAAQKAGKVRFIGITGHGRPDGLLAAVARYPFSVLMTGFNYFDRFSYPSIENELLPLCTGREIGLLAMKSLADGYLYRSAAPAVQYALSLPVSCVVMGSNSEEMLAEDIALVNGFVPMKQKNKEELFRTAPELGDYVCRLCGKCRTADFDPQSVFLLEGLFDRQMDDLRVSDTAWYSLRERLRFWFGQKDEAMKEYARLSPAVDTERDYSDLNALCPYGIDIERKLKIAHGKLSQERFIP